MTSSDNKNNSASSSKDGSNSTTPGKKAIALAAPELSEEDQRLKDDLEEMVNNICNSPQQQRTALESLKEELKKSLTTAVTTIPKPLKFLRIHYEPLKEAYEKNTARDNKILFANILSVLGMSLSIEGERDCLKYMLEADDDEFDKWGHEYVRSLAGEIGEEYQTRLQEKIQMQERIIQETGDDMEIMDILTLVNKIVPYFMKSASEPEACDLLIETEKLSKIVDYCDETNYTRVCLYLGGVSKYFIEPENTQTLKIVYDIYRKLNKLPESLRIAMQLNDIGLIKDTFFSCDDSLLRKQLALMLGRGNYKFSVADQLEDEGAELEEIMGNCKLSQYFLYLAKQLDSLEPKTPEDVYKSHLSETRSTLTQNVDSARQNLASSFVNGFVNAGFGTDKLIKSEDSWIYKNKDAGMLSAVASLGLIYLWNYEEGLMEIDKYLYSSDNNIKAGALLAIANFSAGIRTEADPALAILPEHVESGLPREVRIASILGLGIAGAGSANEQIFQLLIPIIVDPDQPMEIVSFAALSLGMIFVGTMNEDITESLIQVYLERSEKDLAHPLAKFVALGLGMLFLGKQEAVDSVCESIMTTVNAKLAKFVTLTVEVCAYCGTGNVLKIQQLLKICEEEDVLTNTYHGVAALGISLICMGEDLGCEMANRSFGHLLQYSEMGVKRAVPLAMSLLNVSNPDMAVMDTLSKLSHDNDAELSQNAIFALGVIGAGTNNARIGQLLRQLSTYYQKEPNHLFIVRVSQGLLSTGKGLITMNPFYSDRSILSQSQLCGLMTLLFTGLDFKNTILSNYHYLLYTAASAMYPRMLVLVDENLEPVQANVRVGQSVDVVAQAGKPRSITGFQTHKAPVILQFEERAELASEEFIPLSSTLDNVIIVKKNPEYEAEI
ncbi:26S proteasome regulatory subunit S2 [Naegleria gruberi]|uniref:26S proteasome regulatory subunit S2 n=1 Tax=Naegleria gruberi TaxID=5762 RepID=D2V6B3_NAEGR|nr:26S proteasome regulatory subunit S2 [Naegleria gruberi]EFC47417.1 26S proteasome regulatory subunit S2 [Naegleria gruberi]|eukprot:XP_002680161.1 26S proteasome regulatory subunit S2 [Naegleria gruberi strain NEG-M]